ncbi:MAG: GuaB3 family IMP dehydrogenase-related protein [Micrococcales bacterium]|nr:GuaB3 family IMP dehydrogenase-related protein [Micrococcales bacterium]
MSDIVIGLSKSARAGYSFDDVAVAPHRRTRDPEGVDLRWNIDAYSFDMPIVAAPMDSIVSPATAIAMGQVGGLAVLNLEGLWTRHEDPSDAFAQIRAVDGQDALPLLQRLYAEPIKPELITARVQQMREAGITVAGSLSPQKTHDLFRDVIKAGVDVFVIRGTTVSAEHVSADQEPLNLKQFIYELDVPVLVGGVATYQSALHLMRAGAAGVLVGFGGGASHTTADVLGVRVPMASAVADVAAARRDYLDESGGRYVHVIADGAMGRSGDIVKAIACGADAAMVGSPLARAQEAPGAGRHWGMEATHAQLPRGEIVEFSTVGTWQEVLFGPSRVSDGTMNLTGALRRSVALCGYSDLKSFQRVEMVRSH